MWSTKQTIATRNSNHDPISKWPLASWMDICILCGMVVLLFCMAWYITYMALWSYGHTSVMALWSHVLITVVMYPPADKHASWKPLGGRWNSLTGVHFHYLWSGCRGLAGGRFVVKFWRILSSFASSRMCLCCEVEHIFENSVGESKKGVKSS